MARTELPTVTAKYRILLQPIGDEVSVAGSDPLVVGDCTLDIPVVVGAATSAGQVAVTIPDGAISTELAKALRLAADHLLTRAAEPTEERR